VTTTESRQRLPVVDTPSPRRGPDRGADRRLAFGGLVVAIGFLAAALVSLLLPAEVRLGWWLPLHLALAGAAGTAVAAMLPFFVAALAVAVPAPPALRGGAIALVAVGAAVAAVGRASGAALPDPLAAVGAGAYVAGMGAVGLAAAIPLRRATGPRRPATELAYGVGLVAVAIGAALAALYLLGFREIVAAWPSLRIAHAWLNAFGFVGLVVTGTLLHFAPTVVGSRIRRRRSGLVAVTGLAVGPALVALGYATGFDLAARLGALGAIGGGAALAVHGLEAQRDAAGWTTEAEWHRFTGGSLLAAPVWLLVATAIAGLPLVVAGATPAAWRLEPVLAPLVAGFAVQVLIGALAHLVPAIGPGGPERHASARRILGRDGSLRLAAWNVGVAALTVGLLVEPAGSAGAATAGAALVAIGAALLATALVAALVLLGLCLRDGR
jgi:nitrite reductase (NO-forming)